MADCRTPGAIYRLEIGHGKVSCTVYLPPTVTQRGDGTLLSTEYRRLEQQVHDAMENAVEFLWRR